MTIDGWIRAMTLMFVRSERVTVFMHSLLVDLLTTCEQTVTLSMSISYYRAKMYRCRCFNGYQKRLRDFQLHGAKGINDRHTMALCELEGEELVRVARGVDALVSMRLDIRR